MSSGSSQALLRLWLQPEVCRDTPPVSRLDRRARFGTVFGSTFGVYAVVWSLVACSSTQSPAVADEGGQLVDSVKMGDSGSVIDSGSAIDSGDKLAGFHGQVLDPSLSLPEFVVNNSQGQVMRQDYLVGKAHVVWFFRDTGST